MLEVLNHIEGKGFEKSFQLLKDASKKHPLLPKLLQTYIMDENKLITPTKILKMMRYYHVERNNDINKVGEIGEYAALRVQALKQREFGWKKNTNHIIINMQNIKFLIDTYDKIKIDILHKNQYKILKNCFIMISPTDTKWFVRILCKKLKVTKAMREVIKDSQIRGG